MGDERVVAHTGETDRRPRPPGREGRQATGIRELRRVDAEGDVHPSGRVQQSDPRAQLHHRRCPQLVKQGRRQLVGDGQWGLAHRFGVLHHSSLGRREHVGLAPARHLTRLRLVESVVVRHEVVQVEAEAASDRGGACHVRERRQVRIEGIPFLGLAADRHQALEDRRVVPHHAHRLRYLPDHLARRHLHQSAEQAGDLCRGNAGRAGHDSSKVARTGFVPSTWRHRPGAGRDIPVIFGTKATVESVPQVTRGSAAPSARWPPGTARRPA